MTDPESLDQRAFAIFESLLDATPAQRELALQALADESPAIHGQVVALLAADASAALDTGALGSAPPAAPPDLSGSLVGRYRLLNPIGSGGMGVVYRARREDDVDQQVAVKLVRQELRSASSLARFHVERQALARLEHPGIARLIDAGVSADGRPWYVMEYVDGVPIDDYCRDRQLGVRARVQLLLELCRIVDAAHRLLIVHRDLKPGNVLVTCDGRLKLIDFGVAKFIDAGRSEQDLTLAAGAGYTAHFAAPEQVEQQPATTATDVYGIGALAFLLLTDTRLFATRATTPAEYVRVVTSEEPDWPSRISGNAQLRGDLDNIVRKALARDPAARYPSAAALAEDLDNYLADRPVEARAPTVRYRVGKLLKRNRVASALSLLLLGASALGLAAYVSAAREVERQRDQAQLDARRATEVTKFLTSMLTAVDPRAGSEPASLASVVDHALQDTEQKLSADPLVAAAVLETIASVNASLGRFEQALSANQRALEIYGVTSRDDAKYIRLLANRGDLLQRAGRFAEAGPILEQASERIRVIAPGTPEGPLIDAQLAAQIMNSGGDVAAARALLEAAARELRALGVADQRLAAVLNDYGVALAGENRWPEAIAAHREAVELAEQALGTDHMITIDTRAGLAGVLGMAGQFRECAQRHREVLQSRRKVLGTENLDTLWSSVSLSDCLISAGDATEAVGLSRDALAGLLELNGSDHPVSQFAQAIAARAACAAGDRRWGLQQMRDVYRRRVATYGEAHWLAANTASLVGRCETMNQQYAAAETSLLAAAATLERARGASFIRTLETFEYLADLYTRWDRPEAAERWRQRLVSARGPDVQP